jgi:hypothetical protein
MAEEKSSEQFKGVNPLQVPSVEIKAKKELGGAEIEPIKPGDARVSRKGSLLGTCYPTSTGKK